MVQFHTCCVCGHTFPETEITRIDGKFYCSKDIPSATKSKRVFKRPGSTIGERARNPTRKDRTERTVYHRIKQEQFASEFLENCINKTRDLYGLTEKQFKKLLKNMGY